VGFLPEGHSTKLTHCKILSRMLIMKCLKHLNNINLYVYCPILKNFTNMASYSHTLYGMAAVQIPMTSKLLRYVQIQISDFIWLLFNYNCVMRWFNFCTSLTMETREVSFFHY